MPGTEVLDGNYEMSAVSLNAHPGFRRRTTRLLSCRSFPMAASPAIGKNIPLCNLCASAV